MSAYFAEMESETCGCGAAIVADAEDGPVCANGHAPCVDCGHPVLWIEEIGDYRHIDPERNCWLYQKVLADESAEIQQRVAAMRER
jgi:hypothetical protein